MVRIYALMEGDLVLYVGKTIRSLKRREACHRSSSNDTCSRHIPKDSEWEIVLVDEVPDEEGTKWERYYYETLDPLYNAYMPGRTYADSCKNWREQNREKCNEYKRKYRASKKNGSDVSSSQAKSLAE